MNGFGGKRIGIFGSSTTCVAEKELGQYLGVKAFVQNNCRPNNSLKDVANFAPSIIFGLLASDFCQIFMRIILTSTNVDVVLNQS